MSNEQMSEQTPQPEPNWKALYEKALLNHTGLVNELMQRDVTIDAMATRIKELEEMLIKIPKD